MVLHFLKERYAGYTTVGGGHVNLCLVSKPAGIPALKNWAEARFKITPRQAWHTITPLARDAVPASRITSSWQATPPAWSSHTQAKEFITQSHSGKARRQTPLREAALLDNYRREHTRLYAGRLWVNRGISKAAVLHPRIASLALNAMRFYPRSLRFLTSKVRSARLCSQTRTRNQNLRQSNLPDLRHSCQRAGKR